MRSRLLGCALLAVTVSTGCGDSERPSPPTSAAPAAARPAESTPMPRGTSYPESVEARLRLERLKRAREAASPPAPRPVLSEKVGHALKHTPVLLALLTDPETSFEDRVTAAMRGGSTFDFDLLPRLTGLIAELRAEKRLHNWGLRPNPWEGSRPELEARWAAIQKRVTDWGDAERTRSVLGHEWRLPLEPTDWFPSEGTEWAHAPWPLQVEVALDLLFRKSAPSLHVRGLNLPQCERWLDAALLLPCETDEEAALFVDAEQTLFLHVTERILARYRKFVTDALYPRAAALALGRLGERFQSAQFASPGLSTQFQVILVDALTGPHAAGIKDLAAAQVPRLRDASVESFYLGSGNWCGWQDAGGGWVADTQSKPRRLRRPAPMTLIFLLSERGLQDSQRSTSDRVEKDLIPAAQAMDEYPFSPEYRRTLDGATSFLEKYREWYAANRDILRVEAAQEAPALDSVRASLIELAAR